MRGGRPGVVDGVLALAALDPRVTRRRSAGAYTDATLVKRLEEDGIGRPSTYASIISTIERRGYVWRTPRRSFRRSPRTPSRHLLTEHFACWSSSAFTGRSRRISTRSRRASGARRVPSTFYAGDGGRDWPGLDQLVRPDAIEYPAVGLGTDPETGSPVVVRIGRFGPYVQVGEGETACNDRCPRSRRPIDAGARDRPRRTRGEGPGQPGRRLRCRACRCSS